jgi:group I intron endonuclease
MKVCGIYKITSPSNKIYIGQAVDVVARWANHKYDIGYIKRKSKIKNSFIKYGFNAHKFEIIHECGVGQLNELEKYYIDLFQTFNSKFGLNLKDGGNRPIHSEESRIKMGESQRERFKKEYSWNKGKAFSEEVRTKISMSNRGKVAWNKGLSTPYNIRKKLSLAKKGKPSGRIYSLETRKKMSESQKGKILSEETKNKIRKAASCQIRRGCSEETRQKLRNSMTPLLRKLISEKMKLIRNKNKSNVTCE